MLTQKRWLVLLIAGTLILTLKTGSRPVNTVYALAPGQEPDPPEHLSPQTPLGTAFTYQGQLKRNGEPLTADCSMAFRLYDAAGSGISVGGPLTFTVPVSDSLFTVSLDFNPILDGTFTGEALWLSIRVMCPGDYSYTDLGRQPLTAAPYALYALGAPWNGLLGVPPGFADGVDDVTAVVSGTNIFAGDGLTQLSSGDSVTMAVDFAGSGVADTAARSDHDHDATYALLGHTHDDRYYTETELEGDGTASVHWNNLTNRPAGLDDGDDDTIYSTGTGLALAGTEFSVAPAYRLPQGCSNGQIAEWNGTAWDCGEDDVGGGGGWLLTGNAGTTPGTNFVGTTDEVSLTLAVNNTAALRLEPNTTSPNLVGGYSGNRVTGGVAGGTIGGGGASGSTNRVTDDYGTVGGGGNNQAGNDDGNTTNANYATVGGGRGNAATAWYATIGGGYSNVVTATYATIGGGYSNVVTAPNATVGGGWNNDASGYAATVGGGRDNAATANYATVGGGAYNAATGDHTTVGGGSSNAAPATGATVGGGLSNAASGYYTTIGGGSSNDATVLYATVGGGYANAATDSNATVGGGRDNTASGGGATISGGSGNVVTATYAAVGGGLSNAATASYATVGGGRDNEASGWYVTVGGGAFNEASGEYATVPGGYHSAANGDYSFAVGRRAKANSQGCFVWGDSTDADVACTVDDLWVARASGGVYFYTNSSLSSGMYLSAGGSSWNAVSDRARKENLAPIDARELLARLAEIPITTWNYKSQDPTIRHIGPMAQDFNRLIDGLGGEGEDYINTLDAHGVALAAIQGLYEHSQALEAEHVILREQVTLLQQENAVQQAQIDDLEARMAALETRSTGPMQVGFLPGAGVLVAGLVWMARRKGGER